MIEVRSALEAAIKAAGGVRALARELKWHPGAMMNVRAGEKISPYRAAQLSVYLGFGEEWAMYGALYNLAKSKPERDFWKARWETAYAKEVEKFGAELEKIASSPKVIEDPRVADWE